MYTSGSGIMPDYFMYTSPIALERDSCPSTLATPIRVTIRTLGKCFLILACSVGELGLWSYVAKVSFETLPDRFCALKPMTVLESPTLVTTTLRY